MTQLCRHDVYKKNDLTPTSWLVELQDEDFPYLLEYDQIVISLYGKHLFSTVNGVCVCVFTTTAPGIKGCFGKVEPISVDPCNTMPHKIHVTGIFSYICLILIVNVM